MADNDNIGNQMLPISGMESVIATVSGYHGTERFKLIKLISQTGANYVGSMDRCTTHLVCWNFEGKKFDLAKSLGKYVISHRWFEDCLNQRKRLPEGPYTMESGQEAGPITWESPTVIDTNHEDKCLLKKKNSVLTDISNASKSNKADASFDCFELPSLKRFSSSLLSENSLPSCSNKKRGLKKIGSFKRPLIPEHSFLEQSTGSTEMPTEPTCSKRRNIHNFSPIIDVTEGTSRSRRLKKGSSDKNSNHFIANSKIDKHAPVVESLTSISVPSTPELIPDTLEIKNSKDAAVLSIDDTSEHVHSQENTKFCDGEDIRIGKDSITNENGKSRCLDSSTSLACVICLTDFSLTRGVLPCGHRFCYACIQGWADFMASSGKHVTCPLCKSSFSYITKFEESAFDDQKIYSQTFPCEGSITDICVPSSSSGIDTFSTNNTNDRHNAWSDGTCCECHNQEPEDLLTCCHICRNKWVHSCCLDPPLIPWTCVRCSDLRLLYQRFL